MAGMGPVYCTEVQNGVQKYQQDQSIKNGRYGTCVLYRGTEWCTVVSAGPEYKEWPVWDLCVKLKCLLQIYLGQMWNMGALTIPYPYTTPGIERNTHKSDSIKKRRQRRTIGTRAFFCRLTNWFHLIFLYSLSARWVSPMNVLTPSVCAPVPYTVG